MLKYLVVALVACREPAQTKPKDSASADAPVTIDAADDADAPKLDEPAEPIADPGKTIADLEAVAAWQAVVDRAQYLARRGQHGVVYGALGPAIDATLTWLVDDSEGNGALAIRVMLGKHGAKQGDRVALGGAWLLDDARHWYWKVDQLTSLPPAPKSDLTEQPAAPGHDIAIGPVPVGARPISLAKDGDVVYFVVVGQPPAIDGEGWPIASPGFAGARSNANALRSEIADALGSPVIALLNLPGERPSFGGQDFRTADERWQLKRGQVYWLRIGKVRRPNPDKPATINARTAPMRLK